MIVSIHQPEFMPWCGWWNKLYHSNAFVLFDTAQFKHHYFENRNRIRRIGHPERWQWLTLPIRKHHLGDRILDILIDRSRSEVAFHKLQQVYGKQAGWKFFEPIFWQAFAETDQLHIANKLIIRGMLQYLGWNNRVTLLESSALGLGPAGRTETLVAICQAVKATTYISGKMGRDYLHVDQFGHVGIQVAFQDYFPITEAGFYPQLTALDAMMFLSSEQVHRIIVGLDNHSVPDSEGQAPLHP